jgi:hypothetical protein
MRGNLRAHFQDHCSLGTLAYLPSVPKQAACVRGRTRGRVGPSAVPNGGASTTEGPCRYPPPPAPPARPESIALAACLPCVHEI